MNDPRLSSAIRRAGVRLTGRLGRWSGLHAVIYDVHLVVVVVVVVVFVGRMLAGLGMRNERIACLRPGKHTELLDSSPVGERARSLKDNDTVDSVHLVQVHVQIQRIPTPKFNSSQCQTNVSWHTKYAYNQSVYPYRVICLLRCVCIARFISSELK